MYTVVGRCPKTGRAFVSPFWASLNSDPPVFATCLCCDLSRRKNPSEQRGGGEKKRRGE